MWHQLRRLLRGYQRRHHNLPAHYFLPVQRLQDPPEGVRFEPVINLRKVQLGSLVFPCGNPDCFGLKVLVQCFGSIVAEQRP